MLPLEEVTDVKTDGGLVIIEITLFTALEHEPSSKRVMAIRIGDFWRIVEAIDVLSNLKVNIEQLNY